MGRHLASKYAKIALTASCICFILCLSACQNSAGQTGLHTFSPTATQQTGAMALQVPGQKATATPIHRPTPATSSFQPGIISSSASTTRPVLAFYYAWYSPSTWSAKTMSSLPTIRYNSSDDTTIERQLTWAAGAGITGFINSWWGKGDQTDKNFARLLTHAANLESRTGYRFASSLYFESDAPALSGTTNMINALHYIVTQYANNPHFFHWQGKPVLFFWDPLGNGRTLAQWASIRSQVDPNHQMIWSAEGVSTSLLSVFDGLHLFSAGYWGIQSNNMTAVDQGFRAKINAYNSANKTHKIWAAGVLPGYDDTHVPGRTGTYIVPRNNGATYATSWTAAIASHPEWITITSFNEWFEGAMIEPGVNYGTQYLSLTQQYAKQWHG